MTRVIINYEGDQKIMNLKSQSTPAKEMHLENLVGPYQTQ